MVVQGGDVRMEWWVLALLKIIFINMILSGDNAIVIAMASKNLPEEQRKAAVFWGAFGAVLLRVVLTLVAVQLLQVPYLTAIGSLLLVWIAVKLVAQEESTEQIQASKRLDGVIMTIIVADFVMSLDNVIAITAVAQGNILLISIGLLISIPLIIWGSGIILRLLDRFPSLVYLGSAILGFTAGEMLLQDQIIGSMLHHTVMHIHLILPLFLALAVLVLGWFSKRVRMSH